MSKINKANVSNIGRGTKKMKRLMTAPSAVVRFVFNDKLNRFINETGHIVAKQRVLG